MVDDKEAIHNLCQQLNLSSGTELKAGEYKDLIESDGKRKEYFRKYFQIEQSQRVAVVVYSATMLSLQNREFRSLVEVAKTTNISIPGIEGGFFTLRRILRLKVDDEQLKKYGCILPHGIKGKRTKETIENLQPQGYTDYEIAKEADVTHWTVGRIRRKMKMLLNSQKSKTWKIKHDKIKEEIKKLYHQGCIDNEIVNQLGISLYAVKKSRRELELSANNLFSKITLEFQTLANSGKTQKEIGLLYGLSKETVCYLFKKYGIDSARKVKNRRIKEAILKMHSEGFSDNQISKELGITHWAVSRNRKKLGLLPNYPKKWSKQNDKERQTINYILPLWKKGVSQEEISYRLNITLSEVVSVTGSCEQ